MMNYTNLGPVYGYWVKVYPEILDVVGVTDITQVVVETWIVSTERPEIV